MPSPVGLIGIVQLINVVVFAYYVSTAHRFPPIRSIVAYLLLMTALLGYYEGFTLAAREDARLRYGHVVAGVVVEKYHTDGKGHTYTTSGREGPAAGRSGYLITGAFAQWVVHGSPLILMVDYHYGC